MRKIQVRRGYMTLLWLVVLGAAYIAAYLLLKKYNIPVTFKAVPVALTNQVYVIETNTVTNLVTVTNSERRVVVRTNNLYFVDGQRVSNKP